MLRALLEGQRAAHRPRWVKKQAWRRHEEEWVLDAGARSLTPGCATQDFFEEVEFKGQGAKLLIRGPG